MAETILNERFKGPALDVRLQWWHPPLAWNVKAGCLVVRPKAKTDFWQQTHYGFRADNGHFLHLDVTGNFSMSTKVRFHPAHQYDQAGLMVRLGPSCWLKTAVEFEPAGPAKLGAVVTHQGFSDWSLQDFPRRRREVRLRIRRASQDFLVEWALASGGTWQMLRVAHLHEAGPQPLQCGLYACSPKGGGFLAQFEFLEVIRNSNSTRPAASGLGAHTP